MSAEQKPTEAKELDRILWDIPREIETERLILRAPRRGDGALLTPVKNKNLEHLKPWFPWAQTISTVEEDEKVVRVDIDNERSKAVPARLGFKFTGVVESEEKKPTTGEPKDILYFSRKNKNGLPELKLKY